MTSITIRDIPEDLYARIKELAAANRRSINSEILVALEGAMGSRRIDVEEILASARRYRQLTAHAPISDDELNELKRAGRE